MPDFDGGADWDAIPEFDPVASEKSASIDAWLEEERQRALLLEKISLLLLSPEGATHDEYRARAFQLLGSEIKLRNTMHTLCEVSSLPHRAFKKKLVSEIRPTMVLYLVDWSKHGAGGGALLVADVRRCLMQFLSVCRVCEFAKLVLLIRAPAAEDPVWQQGVDDGWASVLPSFDKRGGMSVREAIAREFRAAAEHASVSSSHGKPSAIITLDFAPSKEEDGGGAEYFLRQVNDAFSDLLGEEDEFFDARGGAQSQHLQHSNNSSDWSRIWIPLLALLIALLLAAVMVVQDVEEMV